MARNALIGALRATLGLDTAQFDSGLKNAQKGLDRFGRLSAMATATAAAAAGVATAAFAAVGVAALKTSKEIANLSAEARTAGVAFEEFQRLKYAAAQNQVSIEALTDGLKELNLRANEFVLTGQGSASEVFKRLRYDAQDLAAKLENPSALFTEIIGKLQTLDTASQIRFADELFGGTGGEQFVRFLQGGADGLERLKAEADQLGLVVGQDAAVQAEKFNATMVKLGAITDSVALKVGQVAIPSLQELADTVADPRFAESMQTFGSIAVAALNAVAQGAANAGNNIRMLKDVLGSVDEMSTSGLEGRLTELGRKKLELDNQIVKVQSQIDRGETGLFGHLEKALEAQIETTRQQIEELTQQEQQILDLLAKRDADAAAGAGSEIVSFKPVSFTPDMGPLATSTDAATAAQKALNDAISEGQSIFQATRDPIEQLQMQMDKLGHLLNQGAIDWDTYGRAANAAHMEAASSALGMAGQVTGALASIFEGNKAFAVANAVINTAEGITKALAQGGMFGFIGAAAVAASGAAQVASILAAQPGSASAATVGGGTVETTEAAAATIAPSIYLELKGSRFSRADVEGLIKEINAAIKDGVQLQGVT